MKTKAPLIEIIEGLDAESHLTDGQTVWNALQLSAVLLQDMPNKGSLIYSTRVRASGQTIIEPASRADMLRFATVYCLLPEAQNANNTSVPGV